MKNLTKNLINFAILFFIGTIVFRYGLSHFLENRQVVLGCIVAGIYFFFNLGLGWHFGKKDKESLPLYDIGFRFHLATYLLFFVVSEFWFLLDFQSQYENIKTIHYVFLSWGLGVLIHFIIYLNTRRNTINGINKSDIFE